VQNVVLRRNPLHRLFGVTELRLESAGGSRPEAVMNVITLAEAARLEAVLRDRAPASAGDGAAIPGSTSKELLVLAPRDLLRLGLISQRGMVVVGAAIAFAMQVEPWRDALVAVPERIVEEARGVEGVTFAAGRELWGGALGLLLAALVALQLLSVARAFVAFHRFRLLRQGERITTESGLLTRQVTSARRDKVQRLLAGESWLARRFGRRWLSCEVAAGATAEGEDRPVRLRWLAPVATPDRVAELVGEVAPGVDPRRLAWRPLHPRAFRRMLVPRLVTALLLAGVLAALAPMALALTVLALGLAWAVAGARARARFAAYAHQDGVFAVRDGWLRREWVLAAVGKGQALRVLASPFDRRHGMAHVELDTAGAAPMAPPLRVPYLDEAEARGLAAALRAGL
jgi:putative membrane protein